MTLFYTELFDVNFSRANLHQATLAGAVLSNVNMCGTDLRSADLNGASFYNVRLGGANLRGINLSGANLSKANLQGIDLTNANLTEATLFGTDLTDANLTRVDLRRANLSGTYINDIDYYKLDTMDEEGIYHEEANLSHSTLIEANLSGVNLSKVDLYHTNLQDADLSETNLRETDLRGADLRGANLINASLVRTNLVSANLSGCFIYGISAWDVQLEEAEQDNLIITPEDESTITVDNLEVAQFVYLLLSHKKLRDDLNSVIEKGVLILGRFSDGGLGLLQSIAEKLREMKYLPILFDFPRPDNRNYTETVITLAGLSRFVIADLTGPSVPLELQATIPNFEIPFIPIIEKGGRIPFMITDLLGKSWVLSPVEFENREHLVELLPSRVIEPAEEKFKERQALLRQLFNY